MYLSSLLSGCKFLEERIHASSTSQPPRAPGMHQHSICSWQHSKLPGNRPSNRCIDQRSWSWRKSCEDVSYGASASLLWLLLFLCSDSGCSQLPSRVRESWLRTQVLSTGLCPPCREGAALNTCIWAFQPCPTDPPWSLGWLQAIWTGSRGNPEAQTPTVRQLIRWKEGRLSHQMGATGILAKIPHRKQKNQFWMDLDRQSRQDIPEAGLNTSSRQREYVWFCGITMGYQSCQGTAPLQLSPPNPSLWPPPSLLGPSGCLHPCNISPIPSFPRSRCTATLSGVTSCTVCFLLSRKEWIYPRQAQNR